MNFFWFNWYRVFSRDVTKIGNEVGGHVGVPLCTAWLLNELRTACRKTIELEVNRSRSGIMEKILDSHVIERYTEKVSIIGIDPLLISGQERDPQCSLLAG